LLPVVIMLGGVSSLDNLDSLQVGELVQEMCLIADWTIADRYVCEKLSHSQHCVMPRFAGGVSRLVVKVISLSGKALNQDLTRTGRPVAFSQFGSKQGIPVRKHKRDLAELSPLRSTAKQQHSFGGTHMVLCSRSVLDQVTKNFNKWRHTSNPVACDGNAGYAVRKVRAAGSLKAMTLICMSSANLYATPNCTWNLIENLGQSGSGLCRIPVKC